MGWFSNLTHNAFGKNSWLGHVATNSANLVKDASISLVKIADPNASIKHADYSNNFMKNTAKAVSGITSIAGQVVASVFTGGISNAVISADHAVISAYTGKTAAPFTPISGNTYNQNNASIDGNKTPAAINQNPLTSTGKYKGLKAIYMK